MDHSVGDTNRGIQDTYAGDVVAILVPPDGPYGINLIPDEYGNAAVIRSFDRLPNGKFGLVQKHCGVHCGDVLFEINDIPLCNVRHADTLKILANNNILKKVLKFQNSKEYYRKRQYTYFSVNSKCINLYLHCRNTSSFRPQPQEGKNSFLSAVKQVRLSEDLFRKKYTEYEIACQYRLVGIKVKTEVVYQWSVWKRYSEFEALHSLIRKSQGWQMEGIEFPSPHTFVFNKLAPKFVERRRFIGFFYCILSYFYSQLYIIQYIGNI